MHKGSAAKNLVGNGSHNQIISVGAAFDPGQKIILPNHNKPPYKVDWEKDPTLVPEGLEVFKHSSSVAKNVDKNGIISLTSEDVGLFNSEKQKNGGEITGHELLELAHASGNILFNVNVIEDWMKHQCHIPKRCMHINTIFGDTIYRDDEKNLCVLCGYRTFYNDKDYSYVIQCLDNKFGKDCYVAILNRRFVERRMENA